MPRVKKKRKSVMPKMKMGVHKSRSGGLTAKGVAAYRRANPGSKLKTAVTESNPKGKRAERGRYFLMKGDYKPHPGAVAKAKFKTVSHG